MMIHDEHGTQNQSEPHSCVYFTIFDQNGAHGTEDEDVSGFGVK